MDFPDQNGYFQDYLRVRSEYLKMTRPYTCGILEYTEHFTYAVLPMTLLDKQYFHFIHECLEAHRNEIICLKLHT